MGSLRKLALLELLLTIAIIAILVALLSPDPQDVRRYLVTYSSGTTSLASNDLQAPYEVDTALSQRNKLNKKNDASSSVTDENELSKSLMHRPIRSSRTVLVLTIHLVLCVLLTKLCVDAYTFWAIKFGLVAHPDANRRLQKKPIPLGGGVVVFLMTLITLAGIGIFSEGSVSMTAVTSSKILLPLLISAVILVSVGLADDIRELKGRTKLLSQMAVATIVMVFAGDFTTISIFGFQVDLGHMFYPLGVFWLVGLINAVNFLDGADGVASTAGIFMTLSAGAFAFITGQTTVFIISVVFAGALFGFLLCNFPPAKVYLGDSGSMLIGLVTGVLLIRSCTVENRVIHILPPVAVAIIPIFDTCLSFYRRMSSGRGIFSPDRAHIHHRFLLIFESNRKILGWFSVFFLLGSVVACLGMQYRNDWFPLAVIIAIPSVLILSGLCGREEMMILWERFRYQWEKRMHKKDDKDGSIGANLRYQGQGPWDELWQDLTSSLASEHCRCHKAYIDINIPFLHESYIGRWDNPGAMSDNEALISYVIPLLYGHQKVGTLELTSNVNDQFTSDAMLVFADEIKELCIKYIADFIRLKKHTKTVQSQSQPQSQPHKEHKIGNAKPRLVEVKRHIKKSSTKTKNE